MEMQEYIDKVTNVYSHILEYLENDDDDEGEYQNLLQLLTKITNIYEIKEILYIILNIANNHLPNETFLPKILRLLDFYKRSVQKNFTNFEILHIFRSNKRILLFFIEEKVLKIDSTIATLINDIPTYHDYFYPEIKEFIANKSQDDSYDELFEEKRRKAVNDSVLCQLIRSDSINEFISYINSRKIKIDSSIPDSIFESNRFLLKNHPSIIEYSVFYGAIRIFKYLIANKAYLDQNIWLYSMHGKNPEIFHIIEEQPFKPSDEDFRNYLHESMMCHHNDFCAYFQDNYMRNICDMHKLKSFSIALQSHNYAFFPTSIKNKFVFYDLCRYDYVTLVDLLLKTTKMNIKATIISKINFLV